MAKLSTFYKGKVSFLSDPHPYLRSRQDEIPVGCTSVSNSVLYSIALYKFVWFFISAPLISTNSTAHQVELNDASFPESDFEVVRGFLNVKWPRIAPSSNVTHVVIMRPLRSGYFNFTSAEISYLPSEDATQPQVCILTTSNGAVDSSVVLV